MKETTEHGSLKPTWFDRAVAWTLDGEIYGDERERLRWYEGIALTSSLQWLTFPWFIAFFAWFGDRKLHGPLSVLMVAFYVPQFLATFYVTRKNVNPVPSRWSRKRVIVTVASMLPVCVFGLAIPAKSNSPVDPGAITGGLFGGCIGLAIAIAILKVLKRRAEQQLTTPEDND